MKTTAEPLESYTQHPSLDMTDGQHVEQIAANEGKFDNSHTPLERNGAGTNGFLKNHEILLGFVITVAIIVGSAWYQIREIDSSVEKAEKLAVRQHNDTINRMYIANSEKNKNDIILDRIKASLDLASSININNLLANFNINNTQDYFQKSNAILSEIQKNCLLLIAIGINDHVEIATSIIHDIIDIENKVYSFNSNFNNATIITSPHKKEEYVKSFLSDIFDKIYDINIKYVLLHISTRKDYARLSEDAVNTTLISVEKYSE